MKTSSAHIGHMKMTKRTRIEGTQDGTKYAVREIFSDSGRVFRVLLRGEAESKEAAAAELRGAVKWAESAKGTTTTERLCLK